MRKEFTDEELEVARREDEVDGLSNDGWMLATRLLEARAERDEWKEEALKAQKRHDECYYCNCMNRESEKY